MDAVMTRMSWTRQMLLLQQAERRAVQAARDAHSNFRYSPGSTPLSKLKELDEAATRAQDAVTAHQLVKAAG